MSPHSSELDDSATAYLKKSGATTSKQLYEALKQLFPSLTEDNFADLVERLARRGQIDTYYEPARGSTLRGYLAAWEKSLWFYISIIVSVSAALVAYMVPPNSPLVILRWALGLVLVLFLTGYVALEALFPASQFNVFDRLALSVGVSLMIAMLSGFVLNFTPWGIRLVPIILLLVTLTICLATLALLRQFRASRRGSQRIRMS